MEIFETKSESEELYWDYGYFTPIFKYKIHNGLQELESTAKKMIQVANIVI